MKRLKKIDNHRGNISHTIILLSILILISAVCFSGLATALHEAQDARKLTDAVLIAQNAAEKFNTTPTADYNVRYFRSDMSPTHTLSEATYIEMLTITQEETSSGTLYFADIYIRDAKADAPLYTIRTKVFKNNLSGGVNENTK